MYVLRCYYFKLTPAHYPTGILIDLLCDLHLWNRYTIYTSRRFPIYPHWVEKKAKGQSLRYRANYPLWTRQQRLNTIFIIITLSESLGREGLVDLVSASVFSFWDSSLRLASRAFRSRSFPVFPERKEDHRYHSSAGVFSRQHGTSFFI